MKVFKNILKEIKKYDTIIVARHTGPDPDAIASQIALRDIIKLNYPNKQVYAVGIGVGKFKYLGILDKISPVSESLLITTDVPTYDRIDGLDEHKIDYKIKIDHHPYYDDAFDIEYVDESASSACEIVAEFAYSTGLKMNSDIARVLYAGIVSDSERFLLSYTTSKTFMLVSKLLNDYPFDISDVYKNIYERPLNERQFEAYIISNITVTKNGLGYIKITNDALKKYGVDPGTPSNLVNNLNFIKELKVWAFSCYDEKSGVYKINMRSRNVPINHIAEQFNGGGHKFASGARLKNESEVDALFGALDKNLENNENIQ